MASSKPQSPAMGFLVSALKANPKAVYADLKAKADEKKLKVFPIMYGRAQAMLGIVKSAKRGTGKAAKATAAKARAKPAAKASSAAKGGSKSDRIRELLKTDMSPAAIAKKVGATPALVYTIRSKAGKGGGAKRGPGRPRKTAAPASFDGLAGLVATVRGAEQERVKMRAALEKIQAVLASALG